MACAPRLVALLVMLGLSAGAACAQVADIKPAGTQRIWIDNQTLPATYGPVLKVVFPKEVTLPGTLEFDCELTAAELADNVIFELTVTGEGGETLHRGQVTINMVKGKNSCHFTWTPTNLADGGYSIHLDAGWTSKHLLASNDLRVQVLSDTAVRDRLERLTVAATALHEYLQQSTVAAKRYRYATLCSRTANAFVPRARAAFDQGDWRKANDFAVYLLERIARTRVELALGGPNHEHIAPLPEVIPDHVTIADGSFMASGRPAFFFGVTSDGKLADHLPELPAYGLNLAMLSLPPEATLAGPATESNFRQPVDAFFSAADANGIAVAVDLDPQRMPEWAYSKWPALREKGGGSFPYDVTLPQARALLERHIDAATRVVAGQPNLLSLVLVENPEFHISGEAVREGFITLCRQLFGNRDKMNRVWRTRYLDFNEIKLEWNYARPPYQYDLQRYHQRLGTAFLDWMSATAHGAGPNVAVQVSCADNVFETGESSGGVDREDIAKHVMINGCTTTGDLDRGETFNPSQPGLYYTLLRSLNPRLPVFDTDCGALTRHALRGKDAFRRVNSLAWNSLISGLSGCAVSLEGADGLMQGPGTLEGFGSACLDANRLAPIVKGFQDEQAPLAILWSMSSKIYKEGDPYLASLVNAYRGCDSYGYKVRFISEAQCAAGELAQVRILVVPSALALADNAFKAIDKFIQAGGVTVRAGDPIPYDARGTSRGDSLSASERTVLLRGGSTPTVFLHAVDAANNRLSEMDLPHAVNDYGYPLEDVKTRFAIIDDVSYLFLLNERDAPAEVKLAGAYTGGRDLIGAKNVEFPEIVAPYEPMLIRLDAPIVEHVKTAAAPKVEAPGNTNGVVEPVAAEKSKPKSKGAVKRWLRENFVGE